MVLPIVRVRGMFHTSSSSQLRSDYEPDYLLQSP